MRRILLLGLLSAVAVGLVRLLRTGPGTLIRRGQRAAETLRRRGPAVAQQVARGVEEPGEAADKEADQVREMVSGLEEEPTRSVSESSPSCHRGDEDVDTGR